MRLKDKLLTLADQMDYDVFIPIASSSNNNFEYTTGGVTTNKNSKDLPLAFMPGKLVHTNEILVHLGDNWFTHRSAKQSAEIAERKKEKYEEYLNGIAKTEKQLVDWLTKIDELNNQELVEIHEEYDEQEEKRWREKHRENVKKHKEKERLERMARLTEENKVENLQKDFALLSTIVERDPVKEESSSSSIVGQPSKPVSKFKQQMMNKRK